MITVQNLFYNKEKNDDIDEWGIEPDEPTAEEKARETIPAVKEAWDRYQLMLKLTQESK